MYACFMQFKSAEFPHAYSSVINVAPHSTTNGLGFCPRTFLMLFHAGRIAFWHQAALTIRVKNHSQSLHGRVNSEQGF